MTSAEHGDADRPHAHDADEREALARSLRETEERLRETEQRLRDAEGRYAYQVYKTDYVSWQLRSTFSRRWWRLGEALWQARGKPAGVLRVPAELGRALRKSPMPSPPQRPSGKAPSAAPGTADRPRMPDLPETSLPDGPIARPELTAAVVLDTFSATAFRYEWRQVEPGPGDWREVLDRERPDLLFVESAWSGNDGRWGGQMSGPDAPGRELRELVAHCREQGVPTVFWNKEDPPNFDVFIDTAALFDTVFTTSAEMIPRYREILGHDRVDVLPFAAQPRLHNPVNVPGGRRHDVAFAGTYFSHKHPDRAEQMRTVLEPARDFGLHVYSRMLEKESRFQFPPRFDAHIVGSLPYERMLSVYKAYKVFLNVNSVLDSPTMCARRIFELSACATPVLSGHSAAVDAYFPGLVSVAHTQDETRTLLAGLLANPELRDRQGHRAMREVFAAHTFGHRVDTVLDAVGRPHPRPEPTVSVVLPTNRPDRIAGALAQVARQHWTPLQLVLVLHGLDVEPEKVRAQAHEAGIENVVVVEADAALPLGACLNLGIDAADGDLIAKMDDDDVYGAHYLSDLVPAFSYTEAGIVGKRACYVQLQAMDATLLSKPELEHTYTNLVRGGTIVARGDVLRDLRFDPLPRGSDTKLLRRAKAAGVRVYSADRFNYVYVRGADPSSHTFQVNDAELLRQARVEFYGPPEAHVCI
ncbi:glycosyltransferase family protein [Actinomadura flavalba]|uniref:glycosyltransferase family protein n=1 Tax=Actinomadura flavalba TaxID=1120938 RepID=UPI00037F503B|nr:glycosyltransferase [Actinomadura flavalba]